MIWFKQMESIDPVGFQSLFIAFRNQVTGSEKGLVPLRPDHESYENSEIYFLMWIHELIYKILGLIIEYDQYEEYEVFIWKTITFLYDFFKKKLSQKC